MSSSTEMSGKPAETSAQSAVRTRRMKGFVDDIEALTETNSSFRRVVYTGPHLQLVVMSLEPGGEVGDETHEDRDQFFRIEEGEGEVAIDGHRSKIQAGVGIIVPAGARHNIVNTGSGPLRLYTVYGPPEHRFDTVQATKSVADASDEHFDGTTTE